MNRDLVIGILVSLALHAGAITYSEYCHNRRPAQAQEPQVATIELITMPKVESEKPDEDDAIYENRMQKSEQVFSPPVFNDVPRRVPEMASVQPLQPPERGKIAINKISIAITTPRSMGRRMDGLGEIFEMSKVDQIPEVILQVPPDYPYQLHSAGITGEVTVDCIVDFHGDVRNPFTGTSPHPEFGIAAVRAVSKWKFEPGQRRGRAVNTHVQVPIIFSINKSPFELHH